MKKITLLITMLACSSALFAQTYLTEGFEGSFLPTGWTDPAGANNDVTAGAYTWAATSARANSGTKSAWFDDFFVGEVGGAEVNKHRWLISPVMNLSGATAPELTYYESLKFAVTPAVNNVYYSIDYNGANLNTATWVLLSSATGAESWGIKGPYTLPVNATVYIAYEYEAADKSQWFVDDVLVREPPSCVEPTAGTFASVTATGATFNWSSGPGGTETLWDVELVDNTGGGSPTGTATASGITPNRTHDFSSLTASNTYDVYVRADCTGGDTSAWSGPYTFSTAPTNDECTDATVIVQETDTVDADAATPTNGTIDDSSDSGIAAECTGTPEEDVWYSFVAKTANVNIRFDLNFDGVAVLYSNACGDTPVVVICIDANAGTTSSFEEINATGLTVGDTYYVRVFNFYPTNHANYVDNGNFTIKVWSPDSPPLAVENVEINKFKFYPNPVNTTLNLKAQSTIENVSIYNMLGQEVIRLAPNKLTSEIDMSSLNTGAYFVRVTINGITETKQIIKR